MKNIRKISRKRKDTPLRKDGNQRCGSVISQRMKKTFIFLSSRPRAQRGRLPLPASTTRGENTPKQTVATIQMNSFTLPRFPDLGAASTPPSTLRIRVTSAGTTHDFSQRRIQFFPISFSLYVEKLTISISLDHNGKLYLFFHT